MIQAGVDIMSRPRQPVVEYRNYELEADFPVTVLAGPEWRISSEPSRRLHFHNCFEIGLCLSDSGIVRIGETDHHFTSGDVLFVARNVLHTTWSSPDTESLWSYIHLDPVGLLGRDIVGEMPDVNTFLQMMSDCSMLISSREYPWASQLAENMIHEIQEKPLGYRMCVRGLCTALFTRLFRLYQSTGAHAEGTSAAHVLAPALDYIYDHYMQNFPLESLATIAGMSPTHFRRLFHAQTGTSPLAFLHQFRILKSCDLLRTSEETIVNIAEQVGYSSLSCFNRHFLQFMGCTPSQWRRAPNSHQRPQLMTFNGWKRAETPEEISLRNQADSPGN